jgi:ADP-ribose pyrophosphatase YjhB (NUDIX family)
MSRQHTSVRSYGVLIDAHRIALVRSSNPRHSPALWWLPGGGIKFAEDPRDALYREFKEETGLEVRNPVLLDVASDVRTRDNGDQSHSVRIIFTVELAGGELRDEIHGTTDHAAWFDLDELSELNVAQYARDAIGLAQLK